MIKGLEIISVSLDHTQKQNNAKQDWLNAIEKDNFTWTNVSSFQYFRDPVVLLYNINTIPATLVLDEEGRIVSKNLRGKVLELKVQKLLK